MSETNKNSEQRIAIIGGGLSGLSAAHRLIEISEQNSSSIKLTLYEAANRVGGVFGTVNSEPGYRIESGADSFITNKPWALDLCNRLGLEDQLVPLNTEHRRSLILHNGKPVETPEGFNLLVPGKLSSILKTPLLSPIGKARLMMEPFIPAKKSETEESLADFSRRRLGKEAFQRIVQPMVGGIYTADPERLSLNATLPRFIEMEKRHGSLYRAFRKEQKAKLALKENAVKEEKASGARYGLFATLKDGMSTLLNRLEERISDQIPNRCEVKKKCRVERIEKSKDKYRVIDSNSSEKIFDRVIVCLPAPKAALLLTDIDENLSAALKTIPYASSAIVVSGHSLSDIKYPMEAFGLVIPSIEKRNILAVSFTSRKFPGRAPDGKIQLRTFVGGATQPEQLEYSDYELIERVFEELKSIFGVSGRPDFASVSRWNEAMPQYELGHESRVAKIEKLAGGHEGLELCGNAYHGVGIPDVIHDAENAAQRLMR